MLNAEQIDHWEGGVHYTDRGPAATTVSGRPFHPQDPDPDEIDLDDVCHHLALVNRFGGGTRYPYSVAQHLILCYLLARDLYPGDGPTAKWALTHDLPEYMVGDMIRPVKRLLEPGYTEIETLTMWAFSAKLGLPALRSVTLDRVKHVDNLAVVIENRVTRGHPDMPGMPAYLEGYEHVVEPRLWWDVRAGLRDRLRIEFGQ